ncbi:hypothetical protein DEO23_06330 [Brachybacterium endophyticum]|uniref:Pilus assembly protein CpaE n=1 Tax=Brachybacterium endophyticum TaxID=2182385 RepID=A0A2U2RL11_9MICO|nr:hypothetical protein [Brachybacterium endophyticum]PWH06568.1 hypothetical protein DEO23_06330 [Brachybacterium endophyticum]
MIDVDIARRLRDFGLSWDPAEGDRFAIDVPDLREQTFLLSSMVVEPGRGRRGEPLLKFNGTTEWALDSIEEGEAVWIPREDQLRDALGETFVGLRRERSESGREVHVVSLAGPEEPREIRAGRAEDAYAGALLVQLEERAHHGGS